MKILRLRASFGVLNDRELRFQEGLNLIDAPNESGKTTWCAFIKAMLYGVDSAAREKNGVKPDKLRYAPWSGAPMAGEMDLLWQSKAITLLRGTRSPNAPMREFSAVYTGTNEPVPGLTGENVGETLTGVSRAVFERSAFVGQGKLAVSADPEIEKRISALATTGEEDGVSYSEADAALRSWQRKRCYNKKGSIPQCEGQLREVEDMLERLEQEDSGRRREEDLVRGLELRRQDLIPRLEQARAEERRAALHRLRQDKGRLRQAEQADRDAAAALERAQLALASNPFVGRDPDTLRDQADTVCRRCAVLERDAARKVNYYPVAALAAVAAVLAILGIFSHRWLWFIPACVSALAGVWYAGRMKRLEHIIRHASSARKKILLDYGVTHPEELRTAVEDYAAAADELRHWEWEKQKTEKLLAALRREQQDDDAAVLQALDFHSGSSQAALLTRELARIDSAIARAREDCARQTGQVEALGDPLVYGSRREQLRSRLEQLTAEYDAIGLAIETLQEANGELQSRISPKLGKLAGEYFAALTGGKYADVQLDRKFRATVQQEGELSRRESGFLSAGALDQMYLALRLAVCQLALEDRGACPLVLDDVLVNYDEARTALALGLLEQIARERQVIVFSCRSLHQTGASE